MWKAMRHHGGGRNRHCCLRRRVAGVKLVPYHSTNSTAQYASTSLARQAPKVMDADRIRRQPKWSKALRSSLSCGSAPVDHVRTPIDLESWLAHTPAKSLAKRYISNSFEMWSMQERGLMVKTNAGSCTVLIVKAPQLDRRRVPTGSCGHGQSRKL
jgi:hypothetical protein